MYMCRILAQMCFSMLMGSNKPETAVYTWAHCLVILLDQGIMLATNLTIEPYFVTLVYQSTSALVFLLLFYLHKNNNLFFGVIAVESFLYQSS